MKQVLVFAAIMAITVYGVTQKEYEECNKKLTCNTECQVQLYKECGPGSEAFKLESCKYLNDDVPSDKNKEWSQKRKDSFGKCMDQCIKSLSGDYKAYAEKIKKCDAKTISFFGSIIIIGIILIL